MGLNTQISKIQALEWISQYKIQCSLYRCVCAHKHTHTEKSIYGRQRIGIHLAFEPTFVIYYAPDSAVAMWVTGTNATEVCVGRRDKQIN